MQMAEQTRSIIVKQDIFMPLWYVLSITEASKLNAMEIANLFHESGLFSTAYPDLMFNVLYRGVNEVVFDSQSDVRNVGQQNCVNDRYFYRQWGLRNIGQNGGIAGIDIRACDAWNISTGRGIIVAVSDTGIDLDHPDLSIPCLGWDSRSGSSPQRRHRCPFTGCSCHGTAVAGVIGAVRNNREGIVGVAPDSRIISVSNCNSHGTVMQDYHRARGINWAWYYGRADVINASWGLPQGPRTMEAIDSAAVRGRNGLGTVFVISSGNNGVPAVTFPAGLPNVITVGAINRYGRRAAWSNHGVRLNVVAPGVGIFTTRYGGYDYAQALL